MPSPIPRRRWKEIVRHAGQSLAGLTLGWRSREFSEQFQRERNDRIAQFTEDRKERRQYNEGVRNVIEAQTEAVRTLTAKVNQVLPVISDMPPRSMS